MSNEASIEFTAIDFETANSSRSSVCSVGLAVVRDGVIASRFEQLIRPEPLVFDPFNISIHGIRPEDVVDAPTFSEFWSELWASVSGPLVAHNASFDMSVLRHSLDQCGTSYPKTDYFCTCVISRLTWPGYPTYSLDFVADSLGISFTHHRAEDDAAACAQIALKACKTTGLKDLYGFAGSSGLRVGKLYSDHHEPCGGPRVACTRRSRTSFVPGPS
ncbi:MAG: 3'-5' exonuclease [Lentisphaerae bacterium]|nr:3'-5' exonuclease [Lentisphaerota bacterium]